MTLKKHVSLVLSGVLVWILIGGSVEPVGAEDTKSVKSKVVKPVKKPSWFKADKDGVLWFQQGDDGESKYSASLVLSAVSDGIVITVTANEDHIEDAVKLAIKMQHVLQKGEHTPAKIPIVAYKDTLPGVGYRFYTDGMACGHDQLGKKGVFRPAEAKKMLSKVAKQYRVLTEIAAEGRWGKDHANETALKIVGP